jgi:ribosomal protein S12 methylthiotransferase
MPEMKAFVQSLGCPKNLVDTEVVLAKLAELGYQLVGEPRDADLILVNTCSFIREAVEEGIETILTLAQEKTGGRCQALLVGGCLPKRYGPTLASELPEVDGFFTPETLPSLLSWIRGFKENRITTRFLNGGGKTAPLEGYPRILGTPFYRAYLKIAEGCAHACRFCLIPRLRGPFRSRRINSLVEEAGALAKGGVKELTIVAQDVTRWGADLYGEPRLPQLLTRLSRISGLSWIRLLYLHPRGVTTELLETMAREEKVCQYLDIPFQHANREVLVAMGRRETPRENRVLIQKIRRILPRAALRTSLMVGYPGETEEAFQDLLDFITEVRFHHLGVFKYSPEEGTAAARRKPQVPEKVKEKRYKMLMSRQTGISKSLLKSYTGRVLEVLVEGESRETALLLEGRTAFQAPDIDGVVYITGGLGITGTIQPVKITGSQTYDLVGEILTEQEG